MKSLLNIQGIKKLNKNQQEQTKGGGPDRDTGIIKCCNDSNPIEVKYWTFYGEQSYCVAYK